MKKYLPIREKMDLVEQIVDSCVVNGELEVVQLEESRVLYITLFYDGTDRFVKDKDGEISGFETYDKLMKSMEFEKQIWRKIPKQERLLINELIEQSVKERLRQSSTITNLFRQISSLDLEGVMKEFKDFDLSKFEKVSEVIQFNNGLSKPSK